MAILVSCDRKEQPAAADPSAPPKEEEVATAPGNDPAATDQEQESKPSKTAEPPVLIEKKPPVAEPVPGQPGFVKSPYNGKIVDVKGIPAGSLVADPSYPAVEKKHFRVPEMPDAPAESVDPLPLLDPTILINPGGAKEKPPEPEPEPKEE